MSVLSPSDFPLVTISGDAHARGRDYGAQCAERVAATVAYYRNRIRIRPARLDAMAAVHLDAIEAAAPVVYEEIRGISAGAGVSELDLGVLYARSEIISASECTSVAFPSARVIGQTWDWSAKLSGLVLLLHSTTPSGRRMLSLVEPGMTGKIGINDAGVGICMNFLKSSGPSAAGVPFHVIARSLLECESTADAVETARRLAGACAGHLLVGDASGEAASIEFDGRGISVAVSSMGDLYHTNHYLRARGESRGIIKDIDTRRRYDRLLSHMEDCAPAESSLQMVLQDRGGLFPICRTRGLPFVKDPSVTIAVITMDLRRRRLSIKRGSAHADAPFATHVV